MIYALPILIAAMMIYMFWHAAVSMRRDRILGERQIRRMRFLPRRMHRRH